MPEGLDMEQRVEFASDAWFAELRRLLGTYVAAEPRELTFSLCEVFTGVPAHLDRTGDRRIAWHCRISDGKPNFAYGEIDADAKTVVDYQWVLPLARMKLGPDNAAEYQAMSQEGAASGKMVSTGNYSKVPASFSQLHNDLAGITA
jgi:hypothetical protein